MAEPILPSARRLLEEQFGAATLQRAAVHVAAGRVVMVKSLPWPVVARVSEGQGLVVTVNYDAGGRYFRGQCMCEQGEDCEHVAAVALAALAMEHAQAEATRAAATQAVAAAWLAEVGQLALAEPPTIPTAGATEPALAPRMVAYVLDRRDGEFSLALMQCQPLRKGGLGPAAPLLRQGSASPDLPPWVSEENASRIAVLRAVARAVPHAQALRIDRIGGELWQQLCEARQLFWQTTQSPPLTFGSAQRETLRWVPLDEGASLHRLGLSGARASWQIVPTRDGHYLDAEHHVFGPLDLGVSGAVVQRLIVGPPVPSAMLATAMHSVRALMPADAAVVASPPAPAMRVRMIAELNKPLARAEARHAKKSSGGNATIDLRGEAIYGDEVVALAQWDAARQVTRDMAHEGRALQQLNAWQQRLPHKGVPGSSLDLLADARFVVDVVVPALRDAGWECVLAENFPFEAPLVELQWHQALRPIGEGHDWFALELGVTIAGRTVPLLPILLQAITSGQLALATGGEAAPITAGINLRLPEGDLVYVPPDRLQRWLRPLVELRLAGLSKGGELRLPRVVAAQLEFDPPADDELVPRPRQERAEAPLAAMRAQLEALLTLAPRHESARFVGELRAYQRLGVAWLSALHDARLGGILADEMGLGKTIQVLAFLELLHADATAETLAGEAASPSLVVAPRSVVENWYAETMRFAPQLRPLLHLGKERRAEAAALAAAPLVLTSYQTLLRDLEAFEAVRWRTIMFDEAQQLKNADSQLRKGAARLVAQSRFCLTGTPIENHLGELWSQADLVVPGLFGRLPSFNAVFRRAIEKHGNHERLAMLRQRLAPFLLRRRKVDVELDLPPKSEIVERIELDTAQRDLYETLRLKLDDQLQRTLRLKNIAGAPLEVLDALLKLRQCCCDPRLIALPEARRVTSSAKLERLCDMLEELADSGRKTLVFSQFASMLSLIEAEVQRRGISYSMLTGATRDRAGAIAAFQTGKAAVFLISLKAGGVGLNLTAADTVIHYDPWWNPAAQAQATDRAHRIGQTKALTVYKLVARGTLEEAICQLQAEKQQLTDAALVGGGFTSLRAEDLSALLQQADSP